MELLRRSPRYFHRIVVVSILALLFIILLHSSDRPNSQNGLLTGSWSDKVWNTIAQQRIGQNLMKAAMVSLVRNEELEGMLASIHDVEERFNHGYHYDWVFLNDEVFTPEFIMATSEATSGRAKYGKIESEQWSYPTGVDQQIVEKNRQDLEAQNIPHGSSESYRHMCRYQSGFFYKHPLVMEYDWYWRVEPNIQLFCDIPYDPFRYMAENGKKYGFVISMNEINTTVHSLWTHVRAFMEDFPQHISNDSHLAFLSEDGGLTTNYCHFWDNFEIASLEWFRSVAYNDFFTYLDQSGGFFYERWGDASVHSIAAALMLEKGEIHFFDDIGYHHNPAMSCPRSASKRVELNCRCREQDNMDWDASCEFLSKLSFE